MASKKEKGRNFISVAYEALSLYVKENGEIRGTKNEVHKLLFKIFKPAILQQTQKSGAECTNCAEHLISKMKMKDSNSKGPKIVSKGNEVIVEI